MHTRGTAEVAFWLTSRHGRELVASACPWLRELGGKGAEYMLLKPKGREGAKCMPIRSDPKTV